MIKKKLPYKTPSQLKQVTTEMNAFCGLPSKTDENRRMLFQMSPYSVHQYARGTDAPERE